MSILKKIYNKTSFACMQVNRMIYEKQFLSSKTNSAIPNLDVHPILYIFSYV